MSRLFLSNDRFNLGRAYTSEQFGDSSVMTWDQFLNNPIDGVEYIFSTWGMPVLSCGDIEKYLPKLKAVFYAAGSVQHFARPFLGRGVRVFSAWASNAVPVAEFTAAQIILANKGYFQLLNRYREDGYAVSQEFAEHFPGNYDAYIGLLGAGMIGRHVISLLRP